jgi:predicted phosphodiesterase
MTADTIPDLGLDLGPLDGPVLCFGGPYSNAQATEAVLAEAKARNIPPERTICTGDVVAYCAEPEASIGLVRAAGIPVVMGNCEESLGFAADDCNCGFAQDSDCQAWSDDWFAFATMMLDDDARAWMRGLPRQVRFTLGGRRFAVIHGGAENISEYIFASTPIAAKADMIDRLDVDAVIGGHSGLPFTQSLGPRVPDTQNIGPRVLDTQNIDTRLRHNPGAVGMPANDGTPRGWFSVITPAGDNGAGGLDIALHALDYDHEAAANAMRAALPDLPYAETLSSGLWPNMAVMPEAKRGLRGRPLAPGTVHWPGKVSAAAE